METPLFTFDDHKERNNVLVLLADRLCIGTLPTTESVGMERRLAEEDLASIFGLSRREILLRSVTDLEGNQRAGTLTFRYQGEKGSDWWEFAVEDKLDAFLRDISRQAGGTWDEEVGRSSSLGILVLSLFFAAVIVGVTTLLYLGVKFDVITRGPAFLAMIVNLFGLNGLLAVGGGLALLCLGWGIKSALTPAKMIRLKKRIS